MCFCFWFEGFLRPSAHLLSRSGCSVPSPLVKQEVHFTLLSPRSSLLLRHLGKLYQLYQVVVAQSCLTLLPQTVACYAPLSMEFSRQEYRSGLPFPSPGDFPNPEIKPRFLALQADSLPSELPGKPTLEKRWSNLCAFLICSIALSTASSMMLVRSGMSGHPWHVLILRGKHLDFHQEWWDLWIF